MIKIIFYTYLFIRWTGGWGTHTGLGALFFLCLWTAFMILAVCMAAFGPALTIIGLARMFGANTEQIRFHLIRLMHIPSGQAFLIGHWGTMGLTALVCYFGYYLTGSQVACLVHWGEPSFFEWLLLFWYGYSVYVFFKCCKNFTQER